MKKRSLNTEQEEWSPKLRELKRQDDGFRLPEKYFEGLEDSVFARISAMESARQPVAASPKGGGLFARIFRPRVLVAAAAFFVIALSAKWFFTPQPVSPVIPTSEIAQEMTEEEMIEEYVMENIRDFEIDQLALLAPESVPHTETLPKQEKIASPQKPQDDLSPEEIELLLKDMSDEELESIL